MADPMTALFGKRPFRGTGRADDYFPEAPDLDFLQRPTFMSSGSGYNPSLDPDALVSAGFSPRNAMLLQGIRQQFHDQAEAQREYTDSQQAMAGLSKIDPASKNFSTELLNIFRSNPRAQRNPEILQQADFISRFAAQQKPSWSVEDIEDPDIYTMAVEQGWDRLSPQEARRRATTALTQRTMRGELAALGMTKEDLDKMDRWTQEDFLREKGRLLRESKGTTAKPWYDRIGKAAAEDVRTFAKGVKELQDFEDEFTKLQQDDPKLTRDDYVKRFKGDADFNAYRQRRLSEAIPSLVQEYSLTPQEAAQVLGLGGMIPEQAETKAAPDPFADRTTIGSGVVPPVAAPTTVAPPVPAVSQADLKRVEAPAPVTFESLSQSVASQGDVEKRQREQEFLAEQKAKEATSKADNALWEEAKMKLLQGLTPQMAQILSPSPTEAQLTEIFSRAGIDPSKPAFTYPAQDGIPGREVGWYEVITQGLAQDPRIKKLQGGGGTAPAAKDFSSLWGGRGSK